MELRLLSARIHFERNRQALSLEQLSKASRVPLEVITDLEQMSRVPVESDLNKLINTLNIEIISDREIRGHLMEMLREFRKHIFYLDMAQAEVYYNTINDSLSDYQNGSCFIDYYLTMYFYATQALDGFVPIQHHYQWCQCLKPYLNDYEEDVFITANGFYYMLNFDVHVTHEYLLQALKDVIDKQYKALIHYVLGQALMHKYTSYYLGFQHAEKAKTYFDKVNNYHRGYYVRILIQTYYLRTHQYDTFLDATQNTYNLATKYDVIALNYATSINYVHYYILVNQEKKALETLNVIPRDSSEFLTLKVYLCYRLKRFDEALETANKINQLTHYGYSKLYKEFFDCLYALLTKSDRNCLEVMTSLFYQAKVSEAYFLMHLSSRILNDLLVKHRKYQKANEISETLFEVIQVVMQLKNPKYQEVVDFDENLS